MAIEQVGILNKASFQEGNIEQISLLIIGAVNAEVEVDCGMSSLSKTRSWRRRTRDQHVDINGTKLEGIMH